MDLIDLAETDLRWVLDKQPDNAAALNALGYTLADKTDRYAEAEELIRRAYELQPEDASITDSMGWIAFRQGRLDEAEEYLSLAWALDNNLKLLRTWARFCGCRANSPRRARYGVRASRWTQKMRPC
ncbi:MAG: tetratricopeptide repeat protein [Chromatiales bacterium]|nr:tetratricopeptide repeat protein [Chromatiales bacterium]